MTTRSIDPNRVGPTPLTERMGPLNHGNKWHSWRGLHIPDTYEGLSPELKALHQRAVVEDKSPMNYYSISGPDAAALLDRLVTRDITRLKVGSGIYTPWLNDDGKVVIDTPVFRLGEVHYVTMGGILTDWLAAHTTGYDVTVGDQSDETMVMPVQGPASRDIMQAATGEDWTGTKFMHGRPTTIGSASVWVWRAGYNPQLGFEVHMGRRDAIAVFDEVVAAGEDFGLAPIGQNAVQVARTEAGLIVPGIDYTRAGTDLQIANYALLDDSGLVSPFEIGLGRFVDFGKSTDFIGKQALIDEQASGGASRTLVGLEIDWRDMVSLYEQAGQAPEVTRRMDYRRHNALHAGNVIGKATSVCWSPTLKKEIGLCQIDKAFSEVGTEIEIEWREHGTSITPELVDDVVSGVLRATVVELPFVSKSHKFAA